MNTIDKIYIDGAFVTPEGTEVANLTNPATEEVIGTVRLANEVDAHKAIAAAARAFPAFSCSPKAERIAMLHALASAVTRRATDLRAAMAEEYGAPGYFLDFSAQAAAANFTTMAKVLADYDFDRRIGTSRVTMRPHGVVAAITPWNSNIGFITGKMAAALAAGSTFVIKPSEMSALQTRVLSEALDEAGLPPGLFNIVTGRGEVVGAELSRHPDVAKVSFTGSTAVGKQILRAAAETIKRVTLELGGKGPNIILDDADLDRAIPSALLAGFVNSGQACVAGTRLLVPRARLEEVLARLRQGISAFGVGGPEVPGAMIGPMVSQKQFDRVQSYIALGLAEGAALVTGGPGRPEGMTRGWFTRPTIFSNVTNVMRIAREEIFGPVLVVIPYGSDDEAVAIANDTSYGLQAYVHGGDPARIAALAARLDSGRVVINGAPHDPLAPFGGVKHSGLGREYGVFGLEAHLEPRAILG